MTALKNMSRGRAVDKQAGRIRGGGYSSSSRGIISLEILLQVILQRYGHECVLRQLPNIVVRAINM